MLSQPQVWKQKNIYYRSMDHITSESVFNDSLDEYIFNASFVNILTDDESDNYIADQLQTVENGVSRNKDTNYTILEDEKSDVNFVECGFDSDNAVLSEAALEAYTSKQLTPLLKYELKCLIQARRLTKGMDEMQVQFLNPSVAQLSTAEQEQVDRRRCQNRMAARRFRQKRKMSEECMIQTIQHLQEQNKQLQGAAQLLRREKQLLMDIVTDHLLHCPCLSQVSVETLDGATIP